MSISNDNDVTSPRPPQASRRQGAKTATSPDTVEAQYLRNGNEPSLSDDAKHQSLNKGLSATRDDARPSTASGSRQTASINASAPQKTSRAATKHPPKEAPKPELKPWMMMFAGGVLLLILIALSGTYISENSIKIANLGQSIEQLAPDNGSHINRFEQLDSRLTSIEQAITELQITQNPNSENSVDNRQLNRLRDSLNTLQTDIARLQKQVAQQGKLAISQPATSSAQWAINLATLSNKTNAQQLLNRAKKISNHVTMHSLNANGKTLWRIRATGYNSKAKAERDVQHLQKTLNLTGMWVTKIN